MMIPRGRVLAGLALIGGALTVPRFGRAQTMISREATVNGVRLHYLQQGTGPLILFLHGFPEFSYAWRDQLKEFGRDHLAVAPDQRGYNTSEKPASLDAYRASVLIDDVKALAATLNGGAPFMLVGHDWGGAIAWSFAIRYPELVKKLVIINAPHPGVFSRELAQNAAQQKASQYMLFFRSQAAESTLAANNYAILRRMFDGVRRAGRFTDEDERAYLAAWSQPGALTGGLNYYRASRLGPPADGVSATERPLVEGDLTVRSPTLVIWGERDEALLTGNLVGLDQYVPNLRIKRIPTGSHWVVHEEPELVSRLIREFLQEP